MEFLLTALAGWLDAVGLLQWASSAPWVYPAANVLHLFGLVMLLGAIGIVDLRVMGLWPRIWVESLNRALMPLGVAGLILQVCSGLVLFAADAEALAGSPVFHLKLLAVALALINALAFRQVWHSRLRVGRRSFPLRARLMAAGSLALWSTVLILGRLIAYL